MPTVFKNLVVGLGLVAGVALAAHAQTATNAPVVPGQSIANLPLDGPRPSSVNNIPSESHQQVTQSGKYMGPDPGAGWYPTEKPTQQVQPSPEYPGPKPN